MSSVVLRRPASVKMSRLRRFFDANSSAKISCATIPQLAVDRVKDSYKIIVPFTTAGQWAGNLFFDNLVETSC